MKEDLMETLVQLSSCTWDVLSDESGDDAKCVKKDGFSWFECGITRSAARKKLHEDDMMYKLEKELWSDDTSDEEENMLVYCIFIYIFFATVISGIFRAKSRALNFELAFSRVFFGSFN